MEYVKDEKSAKTKKGKKWTGSPRLCVPISPFHYLIAALSDCAGIARKD